MSEVEVPQGGYPSFDAFFTRRLRPGARPLDPDPNALICPCDGRLEAQGRVDPRTTTLRIKGQTYTARELLGAGSDLGVFGGGLFFVVYLAPPDYHRVHAPVAGDVTAVHHVDGTLFPVNSIGEHVAGLFAKNERVVVYQQSPSHGVVATVMVGAMGVGRIGLAFDELWTNREGRGGGLRRYKEDPPSLDRGDEVGAFHLGSTVILFCDGEHELEPVIEPGERVRVGQALARARGTG
jgi:phosphatidylserine decarboxylase